LGAQATNQEKSLGEFDIMAQTYQNGPFMGPLDMTQAIINQHRDTIVGAFASDSYVANSLDIQHEPIYDSWTAAAAGTVTTQSSQWFVNVANNSGKTLAQTNMGTSRRLDAPQSHSIQSIKLRWSENIALADALALVNGFAFNLIIATKSFNLAPIWQYPAGGGVFLPSNTNATTSNVINGDPSRSAQLRLALPIVIGNQLNFQAQLEGNSITLAAGGAGGTGVTMWCALDGLHARAVV
jgi:hypothetical protein